ncbi:MAG: hypothetical protein ABSB14_16430 [Candidatus Sulfotelmatobacter sp.]
MTPSGAAWHEHVLHLFAAGNDGYNPQAPVVVDSAGDVWGTGRHGGIGGSASYLKSNSSFPSEINNPVHRD